MKAKLILDDDEIPFYGNGSTARDYTYIDDIIDGILKSVLYLESREKVYEIIKNEKRQADKIAGMIGSYEWEHEKERHVLKIKAAAQ